MDIYFSPSKLVFYPMHWKERLGDNWPSDAILVSPEQHKTFTGVTAPEEKTLGATDAGHPTWVDANESEEIKAIRASMRGVRVRSAQADIDAYFNASTAEALTPVMMDLKMGYPLPDPGTHRLQDTAGNWHEFTVEQLEILYPELRKIQMSADRGTVVEYKDIEIP